jgi:hypothetical protein
MRDPVEEFLRLARSPEDHDVWEKTAQFLRVQESDLDTLAVLEDRPDDPSVALLKISNNGEATLFSVRQSERGSLIHETYIGKIPDATITQVHAIADAQRTERVEIVGSRLAGAINLKYYTDEQREALMEALRKIVVPRS